MDRLKKCRKKSGLTLDEAAEMLNISKSSLINYESGKIGLPVTVTAKMLEAYRTNTIDMLGVYEEELKLTMEQKLCRMFKRYAEARLEEMEETRKKYGLEKWSEEERRNKINSIIDLLMESSANDEFRDEITRLLKNDETI